MSRDSATRRHTLYVLSTGNFAVFGTRLLIGALVPFVLLEFQTSKSQLGLALTGLWAVYALLQFPSGLLADYYGERLLLLLGLGGTILGSGLVAVAPSLPFFAVALLVLGAGTGLFYTPATVLVTRLYDQHGGPIGTLVAFGAFAGVVYPGVGSLAADYFGWRLVLWLAVVVTGIVVAATVVYVPKAAPVNDGGSLTQSIDLASYRAVLTRSSVVYTVTLAILLFYTFQGLAAFYPSFLVEYHGVDRGIAGSALGGVLGISTVAQPLNGRFSDAVSRDAALVVSVSLILVSLVVLLGVPSVTGAIVGSILLGGGISFPTPLQARFMDLLGDDERGYGFGLVRSIYMFGGASGSVVVGTLSHVGGWTLAYGVTGGLLVFCLGLLGANQLFSLGL